MRLPGQKFSLWGCVIALNIFATCYSASAKPTVQLSMIITPSFPDNLFQIGGDLKEITVTARVNLELEEVRYQWAVVGPGAYRIDPSARKLYYILPDKLEAETAQVVISVTVAAKQEDAVREQVALTLRAASLPPTPMPPPTPTPTPTPPTSPIQALLEKADDYFKRTFYTEPKEENAFSLCRQVLEIAPENQAAREKIRKMAADYKEWGDRANAQKDSGKAQKYYRGHQLLVRYLIDRLNEQSFETAFQEVRTRLAELEKLQTPVPTVIPSPTPKPSPTATPKVPPTATPGKPGKTPTPRVSPTATPGKPGKTPTPPAPPTAASEDRRLEQLNQALAERAEEYKTLLQKEKQGADIQSQIIPALEEIIRLLTELEAIYRESADPVMLARVERVKATRGQFEDELAKRTH